MKPSNAIRNKGQVYSVGNYLMTGKVLGKGHFARVEEATHRIIGKKVAIKIIDLTLIKEEYARRNLHREPRVMAKLRHPCIAALYETMMHGPRLYVVMEAAGGGDLCAHVLAARAPARGLPEARAKHLAVQLVSAVRHMHSRGVVHRDLKMENIMLDSSKQFIKIVDFGLSNVWSSNGALRTPCGSLEYAAPELFVDGRKYGPEVDLWSIGVIVYGMVTGGLPFTGEDRGEGKSRPQLRAAITKGFGRKQRAALASVSTECKTFIQQLLEPNVEARMKIEEAARHRWMKRTGMRMKTHPLGCIEPKTTREIFRQISELCGQTIMDVVAQIKADPFGPLAGIFNIKAHLHQVQSVSGTDMLWSNLNQEQQPNTPPEYKPGYENAEISSFSAYSANSVGKVPEMKAPQKIPDDIPKLPLQWRPAERRASLTNAREIGMQMSSHSSKSQQNEQKKDLNKCIPSPRQFLLNKSLSQLKKPVYKVYEIGDCGLDSRLPSIDEHSINDLNDARKNLRKNTFRSPCVRKINLEERRLNSCPAKTGDVKRSDFYRKAGDGIPSWRASGVPNTPTAKILIQSNSTSIKRASLGNIVSPHSSCNSHCKSERSMPIGWYSRHGASKDVTANVQRLRRTAPMK